MSDRVVERQDFVNILLADPGQLLVVAGIGNPAGDVMRVGDRTSHFYVLGAMGAATGIGFGLALAQPERPILVVTGDAELLMQVGVLATIGVRQPKNLSIVVLDNERFGATGFQMSHTSHGVDLEQIAKGCAITDTITVRSMDQAPAIAKRILEPKGPFFALVKISPKKNPSLITIKSGVENKIRFRRALLGTA